MWVTTPVFRSDGTRERPDDEFDNLACELLARARCGGGAVRCANGGGGGGRFDATAVGVCATWGMLEVVVLGITGLLAYVFRSAKYSLANCARELSIFGAASGSPIVIRFILSTS
jgi:hypothetical protein